MIDPQTAAAAPVAPSADPKVGVAVVGCGRMGARFHVPALARRDDVELRALVDTRTSAVELLAAQYDVGVAVPDVADLDDADVTAAVVAVPNHLHASVCIDLLRRGIDVLVEKPIAPTVRESEQIAEAAQDSGRILACAHPLRFSRPARLVQELIERGDLGELLSVTVEYGASQVRVPVTDRRVQRETIGGGALMDLGSHVLDLLVWWLGDLAVERYLDDARGGAEADCLAELRSSTGATATVELSWDRDLAQTATFRTDRGTLEVGLGRNHLVWMAADGRTRVHGHVDGEGTDTCPRETLADLVTATHTDFVRALRRGRPAVTAADAVRSVRLIERCYAQREPLEMPWTVRIRERSEDAAALGPATAIHDANVLVTGATGFIGGRLVEELMSRGVGSVRALVRDPSTATRLLRHPVEVTWGTITDRDAVTAAVRGCDLVFHCAQDTSTPIRKLRSGVSGTEVVATAAARAGVNRFVYLSSSVVYGPTPDGDLREDHPWLRTYDPYVVAKRFGERAVQAAHARGLPTVILQPTIVYGPWGKRWTAGCIQQMKTGVVPIIDGGRGLCNAVYVDDVVAAMILAAGAPGGIGGRFLVSAREPVSWRAFYAAFEEALGQRATVSVPSGDLSALARAQRGRLRRDLVRRIAANARQALSDPQVRLATRMLPETRYVNMIADHLLGSGRWRDVKAGVLGGSSTAGPDEKPQLMHVPGGNVVAAQRSRTRVRISEARRRLGYEPRYDLEDGMAETAAFLRWARLV